MRRKQTRRFARIQPESLECRQLLSTLIAEIDTGVDLNSAADSPYYDLADGYNAYTQQAATANGSNIADNSLGSGHGHGSTVADSIILGIKAAQQQTGASNTSIKIMPIRVTNDSGSEDGNTFNAVLRGIFYAAYHHASVINISIVFEESYDGPGYIPNNPDPSYTNTSPTFQQAIAYANSMGAIVVTGAGNNHYNIDSTDTQLNGYYPLSLYPTAVIAPNLIVAASTDSSNNLTSVSNYGPVHVDLGAPAIQDATSYAAGYISGVSGVVSALSPNLTPTQRVNLIESTAQPSASLVNVIKTGAVISPANTINALLTPSIANAASASQSTVTGTSTVLKALGAATAGENTLTYTWSVLSGTGVTFGSGNGTNAGKSLTAQFSHAGNYTFQVTITGQNNASVSSTVSVVVQGVTSSLSIKPQTATVAAGGTQSFSASALDQFGNALTAQPTVNWAASSGTINSSGLFTAPTNSASNVSVTATAGSVSQSAQVTVTSAGNSAATSIAAGSSSAQGSYSADTDFSGGSTYSSSASVDLSGVANPAPMAVYQTERWTGTSFSYTVPGLVPGSTYTVRLQFAEMYYQSAGQRLFDVSINNQTALTNFDIVAAAGGANKAVSESFNATADANGKVVIVFTNVIGGAKVNAISVTPGATSTPHGQGISIAAGSPSSQGSYSSDADFIGGNTYYAPVPINTTGVANAAPQAVYQYQRWSGTNFTYNVPGLTPGATYTVRLHFAEVYFQSAGQRQFNVAINGQTVLKNFDIAASAGGVDKAVVESFTATADSSGNISILFTNVNGGAEVSGVQIVSGSGGSQAAPVDIAAGASAGAGPFLADTDFSGGSVYSTSNPIDSSSVTNPAPQVVYQTERWSGTNFTYTVPGLVPGATYSVRLHFAENYFQTVGQRLFNVAINGQTVLKNFDILATAGAVNKAVAQTFTATADANGKLTIVFTNVQGGAKVNGIEILPTATS